MQEIIKDQIRYSGMPEYVTVGEAQVKNVTKVKDGIRRFRKGIRNRKGQKDKGQQEHMRYNLHKDEDLTWENALEVACRWEAAHDVASNSSSSSSSGGSSEDEMEAIENKKKGRKDKKRGKPKRKDVAAAVEEVASLADKVETNAREIKGVKSEQERLTANVTSWKEETSSTLNEILHAVKQNQRQPAFNQYQQSAPGYGNRNFQRPTNFTWKGRVNQNQQTGFRYNRSTPTSFPRQVQTQQQPASTAAPTPTPVASLDEVDPVAQPLGEGGEPMTVTIPMEQFFDLAHQAGQDVDEADIVASVSQLNFG